MIMLWLWLVKKSTSIEKNEDDKDDPMMRNVDVVVMERKQDIAILLTGLNDLEDAYFN